MCWKTNFIPAPVSEQQVVDRCHHTHPKSGIPSRSIKYNPFQYYYQGLWTPISATPRQHPLLRFPSHKTNIFSFHVLAPSNMSDLINNVAKEFGVRRPPQTTPARVPKCEPHTRPMLSWSDHPRPERTPSSQHYASGHVRLHPGDFDDSQAFGNPDNTHVQSKHDHTRRLSTSGHDVPLPQHINAGCQTSIVISPGSAFHPTGKAFVVGNLVVLAIISSLLYLLIHRICPNAESLGSTSSSTAQPILSKDQFKGATDMYGDALTWLQYIQGQSVLGKPAAAMFSGWSSTENGILDAVMDHLAAHTLHMDKQYDKLADFEYNSLGDLQNSLHRILDEARFFEGIGWPRLCRPACFACGYTANTRPCPDHPVVVAYRETRDMRETLVAIQLTHSRMMNHQHDVFDQILGIGRRHICNAGNSDPRAFRARLQQLFRFPPGPESEERLLDFQAAAYGICDLTGRELTRASEFRKCHNETVSRKFDDAFKTIDTIMEVLESTYPSFGWNLKDFAIGIQALYRLRRAFTKYNLS